MILRTYLTIGMCLYAIAAFAQKLPVVQIGGLRAPDRVKIDGRVIEWGDKFQAYNKATQVFYTIANDDVYLYLIVRATNNDAVQKISMGGITLSISKTKKKTGDMPAITFPVYDKMGDKYFTLSDKPAIIKHTEKDKIQIDSFISVKNRQLVENFKWIGLVDVKGVADSTLSIYNEEGIKSGVMIDADLNFNYELAIPLKYLEIGDKAASFYYNIKLNGGSRYSTNIIEARPGLYTFTKADGKNYVLDSGPGQAYKLFPTDFWGEYTLMKK
ncbi:MAG: hypothetical protein V4592_13975 [Bacteroidota bacterium]